MIGYTTLGTNDVDRAVAFYDKLFETEDVKRMQPNDRLHLWGKKGAPMFGIIKPFDGQPATSGNGTMIALAVESTEKVEQLYRKALDMGATDEGSPGPRGTTGFYGGYFRDLDGHKIVVFTRVN